MPFSPFLCRLTSEQELDTAYSELNMLAAISIVLLCGVITCILLLWRRNLRYRQLSSLQLQCNTREQQLRRELATTMQRCKQNEEIIAELREKLKELSSGKEETNEDADNEKNKYANSSLSAEKLENLFIELEVLMRDEKIFADPLLSIDKLAQRLGTNRTYLSQAINEMTHDSYSTYINKFRIEYATLLLSDKGNHASLSQIATKAGFNSATSFYTIFRKKVGVSPKIFRDNVQKIE